MVLHTQNLSPLQSEPEKASTHKGELVLGRLVYVDDDGVPFVALDGSPEGTSEAAHSTVDVSSEDIQRWVVVKFLRGPQPMPVILGFLRMPEESPQRRPRTVRIEGQKVVIAADQGMELRCGRAHVKLHREGRVDLRGEDIVSRASKHQKIKGGDIQLN